MFFTDDQMQKSMKDNGLPAHIATVIVEVGSAIHNGRLGQDYNKHKPVFGKVKLGICKGCCVLSVLGLRMFCIINTLSLHFRFLLRDAFRCSTVNLTSAKFLSGVMDCS